MAFSFGEGLDEATTSTLVLCSAFAATPVSTRFSEKHGLCAVPLL